LRAGFDKPAPAGSKPGASRDSNILEPIWISACAEMTNDRPSYRRSNVLSAIRGLRQRPHAQGPERAPPGGASAHPGPPIPPAACRWRSSSGIRRDPLIHPRRDPEG
jgi:hypothetical protein